MVIDIHKIIFYYCPSKANKTSILVALLFSFFVKSKGIVSMKKIPYHHHSYSIILKLSTHQPRPRTLKP